MQTIEKSKNETNGNRTYELRAESWERLGARRREV